MNLTEIIPKAPEGCKLTLTPRPDQLEDFLKLSQWGKSANYSQVGTGKSFVSYLYIVKKLTEGKGVIVIMPPPLIPQYISNFRNIFQPFEFFAARLHENRAKRHKLMDAWDQEGWPDILFMSYQLYVKYAKNLQRVRKYRALVADEAQAVSNIGAKPFQSVFQHVHAADMDLLLMTATPTTTELEKAYGHIRLKTPQAYSSFSQFERMHIVYEKRVIGKTPSGSPKIIQQIVGYKDIGILSVNLMTQAVRRRAKDVLSLQAPTIINHKVVLDPEHSELYRRLLEERMLELGEELLVARNQQSLRQMALEIVTNLQKYTLDEMPDEPMENLKLIIGAIDLSQTKLIIFCNFQDTVRKLQRVLQEYNPAVIYGGERTDKNLEKLLEDPTCRIGVLNFQTGGAGFNLQGISHHVVIYEALGSPGMLDQAIGRVHRGGQENPVIVWIFRYSWTTSTKLFVKNFRRAAEIKESLQDEESFLNFLVDSSSLEELRGELGLPPPF